MKSTEMFGDFILKLLKFGAPLQGKMGETGVLEVHGLADDIWSVISFRPH